MLLWRDLANLRDTRYFLMQIGILGTTNCLKKKIFFFFWQSGFYPILVEITLFQSHSIQVHRGKIKVYNSDKCRRYTWRICGRHIWPNLAGQISPCLIEDPRGRRFWIFSDQIFCNDFTTKFLKIKSLLRDHKGANVSLAKFQSRMFSRRLVNNQKNIKIHCKIKRIIHRKRKKIKKKICKRIKI